MIIKTSADFCAALLGATALYALGDLITCQGIRRDNRTLHRIGCLFVGLAFAGLAGLGVFLYHVARGGVV